MSIWVECPACEATFQVKEKYRGRTGGCPHCGAALTIPLADPAPSAEQDVQRRPASSDQRAGASGVSLIDADQIRGPAQRPRIPRQASPPPPPLQIGELVDETEVPTPGLGALPSPRLPLAEQLRRQRLIRNGMVIALWLAFGSVAIGASVYFGVFLLGWAHRTVRQELGMPAKPGAGMTTTPVLDPIATGFLPFPKDPPEGVPASYVSKTLLSIELQREAVLVLRRMTDGDRLRAEADRIVDVFRRIHEHNRELSKTPITQPERVALRNAYGAHMAEAFQFYVHELNRLADSPGLSAVFHEVVMPKLERVGPEYRTLLGHHSGLADELGAPSPAPEAPIAPQIVP